MNLPAATGWPDLSVGAPLEWDYPKNILVANPEQTAGSSIVPAHPAETLLKTAVGWWDSRKSCGNDQRSGQTGTTGSQVTQMGAMRNLGSAGPTLDLITDMSYRIVGGEEDGGVMLPLDTGNYFSTYTAATPTGDLEVIAKVRTYHDSNSLVVASTGYSGYNGVTTAPWVFRIDSPSFGVKTLKFHINENLLSSATANFTNPDTPYWVRVTVSKSTPLITFYTGEDGVNWTQLGTAVTPTVWGVWATSTMALIGMGSGGGTSQGIIYKVDAWSDLTRTTRVFNFDGDWIMSAGHLTWLDDVSNMWVVSRNTNYPYTYSRIALLPPNKYRKISPALYNSLLVSSGQVYLPGITIGGTQTGYTGDLEIQVEFQSSNTNAVLVSKWGGTTSYSWAFGFDSPTRKLRFDRNMSGGWTWQSYISTKAIPIATTTMVKMTLDVDNGSSQSVVTFYYSRDFGETWIQLGAPVTGTSGNTLSSTSTNIIIGSYDPASEVWQYVGTTGKWGSPVYNLVQTGPMPVTNFRVGRVKVYDAGTLSVDFDPKDLPDYQVMETAGSTALWTGTVTERTGKTVSGLNTMNGLFDVHKERWARGVPRIVPVSATTNSAFSTTVGAGNRVRNTLELFKSSSMTVFLFDPAGAASIGTSYNGNTGYQDTAWWLTYVTASTAGVEAYSSFAVRAVNATIVNSQNYTGNSAGGAILNTMAGTEAMIVGQIDSEKGFVWAATRRFGLALKKAGYAVNGESARYLGDRVISIKRSLYDIFQKTVDYSLGDSASRDNFNDKMKISGMHMNFIAAAVFNRALTDSEIQTILDYYEDMI
jgi:hypothetical protein